MKKIISTLMATLIIVGSLFAGFSAYAQEDNYGRVIDQISGASDYLLELYDEFTIDNVRDFLLLLDSDKDMSAYEKGFVNSVKNRLDSDGGKIVITNEEWYQDDEGNWLSNKTSVESPAVYGAVILALDKLGVDYTDIDGYNLADTFSKLDISKCNDNPYDYYLAVNASILTDSEELTKAICDDFVSKFYVMGKGLDYYGFSCDNTAKFVYTLAFFYEDYEEEMNDAIALLDGYKKDNGYYGSDDYTPNANCNSTAMALAAFSALGEKDKADEAYEFLCGFELESKDGVFDYEKNEEANVLATKDALFALEEYQWITADNEAGYEDDDITSPDTSDDTSEPDIDVPATEFDTDEDDYITTGTVNKAPEATTEGVKDVAVAPTTVKAEKDDKKKTSPDTGNHSGEVLCILGTICLLGACGIGLRKIEK